MSTRPEVLVVDDDPDVRNMLAITLEDHDLVVRTVCDGRAALEALAERAADCMVLDLSMPGLDGFAVLEHIRDQQLFPDMQVVILSGKDDERAFVRVWELGAHDFFTKPIDPDLVARKVLRLLGAIA
jgi:two-component system OmpR family response regulator